MEHETTHPPANIAEETPASLANAIARGVHRVAKFLFIIALIASAVIFFVLPPALFAPLMVAIVCYALLWIAKLVHQRTARAAGVVTRRAPWTTHEKGPRNGESASAAPIRSAAGQPRNTGSEDESLANRRPAKRRQYRTGTLIVTEIAAAILLISGIVAAAYFELSYVGIGLLFLLAFLAMTGFPFVVAAAGQEMADKADEQQSSPSSTVDTHQS